MRVFRHRRWRFAALLLLAALAPAGCSDKPAAEKPSIVLILVDTLRADYLGSYGFRGPISPNLDRLARESIVFDRAYSQAPWTKPAIATLFTGLEVPVHQVTTHRGEFGEAAGPRRRKGVETDALPEQAETLAEALAAAGYETAAIVTNPWIRPKHGFAQGFDKFDDRLAANDTRAERVLEAASAWLARRNPERPWFLYLHFMDVHDPYDAPDEDVDAVRASESFGENMRLRRAQLPGGMMIGMKSRRLEWVETDAVYDLREWRVRYAAGVHAFDRRLAGFLDELRANGTLDRSVVVVTSDHGEELYENGDWAHGKNLHNHQLHIPLFVRLPGGAQGGRRVADLAALTDVMPTLLGLAGAAVPKSVQGRDLLAPQDESRPPRTAVFASGVKWHPDEHAVQSRDRKLIRNLRTGRTDLFDTVADPWERSDVADERAVEVFQLGEVLDRHLAEAARHPGIGRATAEIDPESQERLRSLGYLE
jgi:arylsulfatase A-like enzyme